MQRQLELDWSQQEPETHRCDSTLRQRLRDLAAQITELGLPQECEVLQRLVYTGAGQKRAARAFQRFRLMARRLSRIVEADTAGLTLRFVKAFSNAVAHRQQPALALKEVLLERVAAMRRLTVNATLVTETSFVAATAELRKALFVPFYTIVMSAASRIHVKLHCLYRYQSMLYTLLLETLPPEVRDKWPLQLPDEPDMALDREVEAEAAVQLMRALGPKMQLLESQPAIAAAPSSDEEDEREEERRDGDDAGARRTAAAAQLGATDDPAAKIAKLLGAEADSTAALPPAALPSLDKLQLDSAPAASVRSTVPPKRAKVPKRPKKADEKASEIDDIFGDLA